MDNERWRTESGELNRVLGGGLVPGSAILMGGAPGAGKSTLLLQVVSGLAERKRCLYITGEESLAQVALRAKRLKLPVDAVSVAAQTSLGGVFEYWDDYKLDVLVVDSIQVMHSESLETLPGSVSQVRRNGAPGSARKAIGNGPDSCGSRHQGGQYRGSARARAHD